MRNLPGTVSANDLAQPAQFQAAVHATLESLRAELGHAATLSVASPDGSSWRMTATGADAASFEVRAYDHEDVQLVVDPGCIIEFWEQRAPSATLAHLEDICRSIVAGRLTVVRKRSSGALKFRLQLSDGQAIEGATSWWLPVMPWTQVETINFSPYLDTE